MGSHIDNILKECEKLTTGSPENENVIAIFGSKGCGKSTLLKFLLRDQSLCINKDEQDEFYFEDPGQGIIGNDRFELKIASPNVRDEISGCHLFDCAGFNDLQNKESDFIASIVNKAVLDRAKSLKIVIVDNFDKFKLQSDKNAFRDVLNNVSELLKYNLKLFRHSICLVVNKIDSTRSDPELIESVRIFLVKMRDHLKEMYVKTPNIEQKNRIIRERSILKYLTHKTNIGIFRTPTEIDSPWKLEPLHQNYISLRKLVFEDIQFTNDIPFKFNIIVAPDTRIWIAKLLSAKAYNGLMESFKIVTQAIQENQSLRNASGGLVYKILEDVFAGKSISENSPTFTEGELSTLKELGIPELCGEFNVQKSKLMHIFEVIGREEDLRKCINECSTSVKTEDPRFNELVECLAKEALSEDKPVINAKSPSNGVKELQCDDTKLIEQEIVIKPEPKVNERKISAPLQLGVTSRSNSRLKLFETARSEEKMEGEILKNLSYRRLISTTSFDFSTETSNFKPTIQWLEDRRILIFQGRYITLSKILPNIDEKPTVTQVVLAASESLYIDCDLTMRHTHIVLIAPCVEIMKRKRFIRLVGENGSPHQSKQAPSSSSDSPGSKGVDGKPGYSSGSFLLVAYDIKKPDFLEVQSEGGDGGDGQQGGDGGSVAECDFPDFKGIENFSPLKAALSEVCSREGFHTDGEADGVRYYQDMRRTRSVFNIKIEKHPDVDRYPSDGGEGGKAGSSAMPGKIELLVVNSIAKAQVMVNAIDGKHGRPGLGGRGGKVIGKFRNYECEFNANLVSMNVRVRKVVEEGDCICESREARNGSRGQNATGQYVPRYKYSSVLFSFEEIVSILKKQTGENNQENENFMKLLSIF